MGKLNLILTLKGVSNNTYKFSLYTIDTEFKEGYGGIYIFIKGTKKDENSNYDCTTLYIGKTQEFKDRFYDHEKWEAAKKLGFNILGIYKETADSNRLAIEEDLIRSKSPRLNVQHNS